MITTLLFIQLIAFQLWYVTSNQVEHKHPPAYLRSIIQHKQAYRMAGAALMLLTVIAFIVQLGWTSGIFAGLVGLMGIGNLVVMLNPFRYLNEKAVVALFALFLVLEFLI